MANEVAVRVGGLTVGALQNVAENRHIITSDGELLDVTLATDDDLVIWSLVTQRLRTLARNIEQGVNAGASAIVVTVDAPYAGRRERDLRNGFVVPDGIDMPGVTAAL